MPGPVEVQLVSCNSPICYPEATVYEKGSFTCVSFAGEEGRTIHKYPTANIFRLKEGQPWTNHGEK